jgi:hypothetical protein
MQGRYLHRGLRLTATVLLIAPWIAAWLGHPMPELFIVSGLVLLLQAAMIQTNYLGAAEEYVLVNEAKRRKIEAKGRRVAPVPSPTRLVAISALLGATLLALGLAGSLGTFGGRF